VKSVVLSGRLKAPVLEPYFLYVMNTKQHTEYAAKGGPAADPLASWMLSLGVRVVGHVVSFANRKGFEKQKAQGAQWARLDLFKMSKQMVPEFKKRGLMTSHVLYTDMDVFFSHDPPLPGANTELRSCGNPLAKFTPQGKMIPRASWSKCINVGEHGSPVSDPNFPYVFGAGSEIFTPWGMNSGVMYINVENITKYAEGIIDFAATKNFRSFNTQDQACMEKFFTQDNFGPGGANAWDWLDDAVINSRGFISPSEFLVKHPKISGGHHRSRSAVWHWHGYKADQIRCIFHRIKDGSWDVTKDVNKGPKQADVPGCEVVKGSGAYPNAMKGCYLVTYAWMLNQHERLQQMARTMRLVQEGEG